MSSKQIPKDGSLRVTVTVKNDGKYAARELVQLYVQDVVASVTQPIRELKAYKHVDLPPNRSQQVTFDLTAADLAFLGVDLKPVVETGKFKLWVAPSAEAESLAGEFEIS